MTRSPYDLLTDILPGNRFYARKDKDEKTRFLHHQARTDRRPKSQPAVRHKSNLPSRSLHPLLPNQRHLRPSSAVARYRRKLELDARQLGPRVSGRRRQRPGSHFFRLLLRTLPRILDRLRRRYAHGRARNSRRRHAYFRPPAHDFRNPSDGPLLHADLRHPPRGSRGGGKARSCRLSNPPHHRRRRTRRQHPFDQSAH